MLDCLAAAVTKFIGESICLQGERVRHPRVVGRRPANELFDRTAQRRARPRRGAVRDTRRFLRIRHGSGRTVGRTRRDRVRSLAIHAAVGRRRRRTVRAWRIRRVTGKFLALARILKAGITFDGGLDYIVWKLERHSGKHIEVPERVRRRPALHMWAFSGGCTGPGCFVDAAGPRAAHLGARQRQSGRQRAGRRRRRAFAVARRISPPAVQKTVPKRQTAVFCLALSRRQNTFRRVDAAVARPRHHDRPAARDGGTVDPSAVRQSHRHRAVRPAEATTAELRADRRVRAVPGAGRAERRRRFVAVDARRPGTPGARGRAVASALRDQRAHP